MPMMYHSRRERAQRAVGAGVAVRADDHRPREGDALFGQERVLDAHFADVIEVLDVVGAREIAHDLALLRRLDVAVGGEVVEHERDLALVAKPASALLEHVDRDGRGHVVGQRDVRVDQHEIAPGKRRVARIDPQLAREDLLCVSSFHIYLPKIIRSVRVCVFWQ